MVDKNVFATEPHHFLNHDLSPSVFDCGKNPFDVKVRIVEDPRNPEQQLRMKNVWCQYVRTENGVYCYTYPRLEYRAARLAIDHYKTNVANV